MRQEPARQFVQQFLLIVEGKTEKIYFDYLKRKVYNSDWKIINVEGKLQKIKKGIDQKDVVKSMLIFDMDVFDTDTYGKKHKILKSLKENEKYKEKLVWGNSSPCFEFWLCLHLVDQRIDDKKKLAKILNDSLNSKDYKKGFNFKMVEELLGNNNQNLKKAIDRAKKYKKEYNEEAYTEIPQVIALLDETFVNKN